MWLKPHHVFAALGVWFFGLALIIVFHDVSAKVREEQLQTSGIGYMKDGRTGICYATAISRTRGDTTISITAVPCTPEVEAAILNDARRPRP